MEAAERAGLEGSEREEMVKRKDDVERGGEGDGEKEEDERKEDRRRDRREEDDDDFMGEMEMEEF